MKYMGSKRNMLKNGLGDILSASVRNTSRVLDLFTGSGVVAWHMSELYEHKVIAVDLQAYATALAASVIERTSPLKDDSWIEQWFLRAIDLQPSDCIKSATELQRDLGDIIPAVAAERARAICQSYDESPITSAYGGYYFSPFQALWLDTLRRTLPKNSSEQKVALAALIQAASECAASPGHTAQPFKANRSAGFFLIDAWRRDLPQKVSEAARRIAQRHARVKGQSMQMDANDAARMARERDLVFLDPPYSGVHYSRFYHVLETIARGEVGPVTGVGRYPPQSDRPKSAYSLKAKSRQAFDDLLYILSNKGASVIITFPAGRTSNGISGTEVTDLAEKHFKIIETKIASRFSTLGGNTRHREARQNAIELILQLSPK